MELVGKPSCELEQWPAHAPPPDLRRSFWPYLASDRILICLKAKFTLPPPDRPHLVLRCQHTFSAPLERLTGHAGRAHDMVACMLSAVRVPAVPSIVGTIQHTLCRIGAYRQSRRREWAPWIAFKIGIVVRRMPRAPEPYEEGLITYFDDLHHLYRRGFFQIDYVFCHPLEYRQEGHRNRNYSAIYDEEIGEGFLNVAFDNGEEGLDYILNALSRINLVPASKESIRSLDKVMIKEDETLKGCTICLEEIVVGTEATVLPCSHHFHGDCIAKWLGNSRFCPLCRYEISL